MNLRLIISVAAVYMFCTGFVTFRSGEREFPASSVNDHVLIETLDSITAFIAQKNGSAIQRFINPRTGLIVYYRNGIFEDFIRYTQFPEELVYPGYYPFTTDQPVSHFTFEELPAYSCDTTRWTKSGSFCDTTPGKHYLSESIALKENVQEQTVDPDLKNHLLSIESAGIMAICTEAGPDGLVFWLLKEGNAYYLVLIDLVSTDCSA